MAKANFDGVVGSGVLRIAVCASVALGFLVSCDGSSSSSEASPNAGLDSFGDLPLCNGSLEGAILPHGDSTYVCSNGSWQVNVSADTSAIHDLSIVDTTSKVDSSVVDTAAKADTSLADTTVAPDTTTQLDTNATVDTSAVADTAKTDSVPEQKPLEKKNVSLKGFAEYGIFDSKTTIVVEELDSALNKTGVAFTGTISAKDGSFSIKNASMMGPYALVTVAGSASNMALGSLVRSSDTLSVIVLVEDSVDVNINALSFLVSERVKALLKSETTMDFAQVSKKAIGEVWAALGFKNLEAENPGQVKIADGKESGSAVQAMTVMLQAMVNDSVANITEFAKAVAEGSLEESPICAKLADWAFNEDVSDEFDEVKNNIKKQGVALTPDFEKVLKSFYLTKLGLDECDESIEGKITFALNEFSSYYAADYSDVSITKERIKCEDGSWSFATDKEKDTFGFENGSDGEVRQGLVNADKVYSFNGSSWRVVTSRAEKDAYFVQKSNITDFVDIQEVYESIKDDEKVIFLLRHGERDKDATSNESPLSKNGYEECVMVGKKLTKFSEPFRLGASTFYRAQQTSIGIAAGRGQDTTVADTLDILNDNWYMIDRNLVNQAESNAGGGWEAIGFYVYDEKYLDAYYDLEDRSALLIDTLVSIYSEVPDRFILLSSHDKLMVPFVAYCSNLKIDMKVREVMGGQSNEKKWINYLAGIAIIWDKSGNRRYVAVKGLDRAFFAGWDSQNR